MRRKCICLVFIMFFAMIGSAKAKISYDITKMDLTSSGISFEGWAIRVSVNNYGGHTSKIEMIAKGSANQVRQEVELTDVDSSSNNFYPVMCVNYHGRQYSSQVGNGLCKAEKLSSCSAGDCIYRNVKFRTSFDMSTLQTLGENIRFSIVISYNSGLNSTANSTLLSGGSYDTPNSEEKTIGVYTLNCHIGGNACNVGENKLPLESGSEEEQVMTATISNVSDTANVIQSNAKIQYEQSGGVFRKISDNCKLVYNSNIRLLALTNGNMSYLYANKFEGAGNFGIQGYKVSTVNHGATGCGGTGFSQGYAYGSWLEVDKELVLNVSQIPGSPPGVTPQECNDNQTIDAACENESFENSCKRTASVDLSASHSESGPEGTCSGTGHTTIYADYQINQTGDLVFHLDRGPVYSGGGFTFDIEYENLTNWYFVGEPDKCPLIDIPNGAYGEKRCNCDQCCDSEGNNCHSCHCDTCLDCQTAQDYSPECPKDSTENINLFQKKIAKDYQGEKIPDENNMIVTLPDSNDVKGPKNNQPGKWECDIPNPIKTFGSDEAWAENEELYMHCKYTLKDAFIRKKDAIAMYGTGYSHDDYLVEGANEGAKYFVPLRWSNSTFDVLAEFKNLSSIKGMNWQGKYKCDVECQQRLYNTPNGVDGNDFFGKIRGDNTPGLYVYFYRPILLNDPFPNRDAGSNWIDWIADASNVSKLRNSYNDLEYTVSLSTDNVVDIRRYNSEQLTTGDKRGYLDYSINNSGESSFINSNVFANRQSASYSGLGVFDE